MTYAEIRVAAANNVFTVDFSIFNIYFSGQFKYSGQNLGIRETSKRAINRKEMTEHFMALINIWIAEGSLFCNQTFIDSFRPHPNPE